MWAAHGPRSRQTPALYLRAQTVSSISHVHPVRVLRSAFSVLALAETTDPHELSQPVVARSRRLIGSAAPLPLEQNPALGRMLQRTLAFGAQWYKYPDPSPGYAQRASPMAPHTFLLFSLAAGIIPVRIHKLLTHKAVLILAGLFRMPRPPSLILVDTLPSLISASEPLRLQPCQTVGPLKDATRMFDFLRGKYAISDAATKSLAITPEGFALFRAPATLAQQT